MPSLPATQLQLFAFEENIESFIVAYFLGSGIARVGRTRSPQNFLAPYVGVTFYNGNPVLENQHPIAGVPGAYLPWNTYDGRLLTSVATIRADDPTGSVHTGLLAQVRMNLQLFNLIPAVAAVVNPIDKVSFCVEGESTGFYDDEKDIDYTEITWTIRHTLNPAAWPDLANYTYLRPDGSSIFRPDGTSIYVRP